MLRTGGVVVRGTTTILGDLHHSSTSLILFNNKYHYSTDNNNNNNNNRPFGNNSGRPFNNNNNSNNNNNNNNNGQKKPFFQSFNSENKNVFLDSLKNMSKDKHQSNDNKPRFNFKQSVTNDDFEKSHQEFKNNMNFKERVQQQQQQQQGGFKRQPRFNNPQQQPPHQQGGDGSKQVQFNRKGSDSFVERTPNPNQRQDRQQRDQRDDRQQRGRGQHQDDNRQQQYQRQPPQHFGGRMDVAKELLERRKEMKANQHQQQQQQREEFKPTHPKKEDGGAGGDKAKKKIKRKIEDDDEERENDLEGYGEEDVDYGEMDFEQQQQDDESRFDEMEQRLTQKKTYDQKIPRRKVGGYKAMQKMIEKDELEDDIIDETNGTEREEYEEGDDEKKLDILDEMDEFGFGFKGVKSKRVREIERKLQSIGKSKEMSIEEEYQRDLRRDEEEELKDKRDRQIYEERFKGGREREMDISDGDIEKLIMVREKELEEEDRDMDQELSAEEESKLLKQSNFKIPDGHLFTERERKIIQNKQKKMTRETKVTDVISQLGILRRPTNEEVMSYKVVRLVDENGKQIRITSGPKAFQQATAENTDCMLVDEGNVNDPDNPPVIRLLNYDNYIRKLQDQLEKKIERENVKLKSVFISPTIHDFDLQMKTDQIKNFLDHNCKVHVFLVFPSEDSFDKEVGNAIIKKIKKALILNGAAFEEFVKERKIMVVKFAPLSQKQKENIKKQIDYEEEEDDQYEFDEDEEDDGTNSERNLLKRYDSSQRKQLFEGLDKKEAHLMKILIREKNEKEDKMKQSMQEESNKEEEVDEDGDEIYEVDDDEDDGRMKKKGGNNNKKQKKGGKK